MLKVYQYLFDIKVFQVFLVTGLSDVIDRMNNKIACIMLEYNKNSSLDPRNFTIVRH